jgi:hypothetical protein
MATQDGDYRKVNTVAGGRLLAGMFAEVTTHPPSESFGRTTYTTANDIETSAEHTYGVQRGIAVLKEVRRVCR